MMGSPLTGKPEQTSLEGKPLWYKTLAAASFLLPYGCVSSSDTGKFYKPHGYYEDETPVHEVCVDGFWMGKYEVTINQYVAYFKATGNTSGIDLRDADCPVQKGGSYSFAGNRFSRSCDQPMVEVNWQGAKAFADWLAGRTGKSIRLPTEAEWEYAARSGGKKERCAGGGKPDPVAWYDDNSDRRTHDAGGKVPNEFGLHDMSGNVWEWCADWYNENAYNHHSRNNPIYDGHGDSRVVRGGSWISNAKKVRSTDRFSDDPEYTLYNLGFRLVWRD